MDTNNLIFQQRLPAQHRAEAAALYDAAFGEKFGVAIRNPAQRLALLHDYLAPEYAIVALRGEQLAGVAGFQTDQGSFTGGMFSGNSGFGDLVSRLGLLRAIWAGLILSLYTRKPAAGELLMDGITVHPNFRSQGIGGRLLDEVVRYAQENGYQQVRLDVIDTNPRARQLYERKGFEAIKTEHFPFLRWLIGFGASTTMRRLVD